MIVVLLPTYREAKNLPRIIPKIFSQLTKKDKILVVNDVSGDGTKAVVTKLKKKYPVVLIERKKKEGFGKAVIQGLKKALAYNPEWILQLDADLSHPPEKIPALLKKARAGFDVVIGSRYVKGGGIRHWHWYRKLLSRTANMYARILLGLSAHDVTGAYRVYSPALLRQLSWDFVSYGYTFQEEILYQLMKKGARVAETPIIYTERTTGSSNMPKFEMITGALKLLRVRFKWLQ